MAARYDDAASLTGSDEYLDDENVGQARRQQGNQGRRPSKAERFFGIGDDAGPWGNNGAARRSSMQGEQTFDDEPGMGKKKGSWKVWK
jgi:hypothetical protein